MPAAGAAGWSLFIPGRLNALCSGRLHDLTVASASAGFFRTCQGGEGYPVCGREGRLWLRRADLRDVILSECYGIDIYFLCRIVACWSRIWFQILLIQAAVSRFCCFSDFVRKYFRSRNETAALSVLERQDKSVSATVSVKKSIIQNFVVILSSFRTEEIRFRRPEPAFWTG